jgi:hypothetical protein
VLAAVVVLGGGYFGWKAFFPAAPVPSATKQGVAPKTVATTPTQPAKAVVAPAVSAKPVPPVAANSSSVAHGPVNAIAKTQSVTAVQSAATQAASEVLGPDRPAATGVTGESAEASVKAPVASTTTVTELAPGVSATRQVEAAPAASSAFRTAVANLKISGFIGGPSAKALINGRLVHVGDVIDSSLGITFAGEQEDQLVFKDRSGATVVRRY